MTARYMQPLRILVQSSFLVFMIWLGISFYRFFQAVNSGFAEGTVLRPNGIDGFLPISGFLGTIFWAKEGEINSIHPAAVCIFVTVILVSLLLRRSFCSWICPVATISEWLWKGGFRFLRCNYRLPVWLDCALRSLKYLIMAFFVYAIVIAMSPDELRSFINSDFHKITDIRLLNFFLHISPVALGVIAVFVVASFALRNPFCRYFCPYGALLGLIATLSPVRVTRNHERCVSCSACNQVCPTYIDVMNKSSVFSPECIACWRCVSNCRFNDALSMRFIRRFEVPGFIFAVFVLLFTIGGSIIGKMNGHWVSSVSPEEYVRILGK